MRALLTSLLVVVAWMQTGLKAQHWAKDFGGLGADAVTDVKADLSGNVYVTGEFSLSITYDGQTIVSAGATDVFVAKLGAGGSLDWLKRAGGPGIDRGLKLAVDGSGAVALTGQFTGTADLFGSTFTSLGGTMDVFIVRLQAATGDAAWVRVGGASLASDRPYGVTLSPNGHITVAGDFRGTADFDGTMITSAYDPLLLAPGFDVFIASYSTTGILLWVQQGTATHTDRAIDVVSDVNNGLYVCGQFSDTITFDVSHVNTMMNATFLVKFDPLGTELWFRRIGGAGFNHVRDMQVTDGGELLLCGDLQGTMTFFDSSPDAINGLDAFAYYLLRVDLNGELIAHTVEGSDDPMSVAALDQRGGIMAVLGEFDCQFTGLSDFYSGNGLFMATGPEDLFIARHVMPDLSLSDAQQFGGQHHKYPGGLASLSDGSLVFGGGYERLLVIPSDGAAWGDVQSVGAGCPLVSVNNDSTYCGDADYGHFVANNSAGAVDGFVTRGYVTGRAPYDVWNRWGSIGCERPALEPCVFVGDFPYCDDTVHVCEPVPLSIVSSGGYPFSYWEDVSFLCGMPLDDSTAYTGFDLSFLWSDGSTDQGIGVYSTGWYACTMTTSNSCWSWTDSIYVQFESAVYPGISDALGVNVAAIITEPLVCVDTLWLWCPIVPPGYSVSWTDPDGNVQAGDSILADESGVYMVTLISPYGCSDFNFIDVTIGAITPMPNITDLQIDLVVTDDTVYLCPFSSLVGSADVTWYIDGLPVPPPPGLTVHVTDAYGSGYYAPASSTITWQVTAFGSGWIDVVVNVDVMNPPCGEDTLQFAFLDSIYVEFVPWSEASIDAPSVVCPGDTVPLVVTCVGCDNIAWTGPGIVGYSPGLDTCWINAPGVYDVTVSGTFGGLTCPWTTSIVVAAAAAPPLFIDPGSGMICPGDTAIIFTTYPATDYQWTGPLGGIPLNNDSIIASEPGDYYLFTTDANGCELSNGPVTLEEFGSPFINAYPDAMLCPGEGPVLIEIVTSDPDGISWNPPLSGSSPTQFIGVPGTYSATVVSCGISWFVSITITEGLTEVPLLDPGPFTFCEGDSVLLQGPPGMVDYVWSPGGWTGQTLWVTDAGAYALTVTDLSGCSGTSEDVLATVLDTPDPVSASDMTICEGEIALLEATGAGTINWYAYPGGVDLIGSGSSITVGPLSENDTMLVAQSDGLCEGPMIAVVVNVLPLPGAPTITGDQSLCEGDALVLVANGPPGSAYEWITPVGTGSSSTFSWSPAYPYGSGTYQCWITVDGCTSPPASVEVIIVTCEVVIPNVLTPNGDGENDVITITGFGHGVQFNIWNRWGQVIALLSGEVVTWNGRNMTSGVLVPEGVYFYEVIVGMDGQEPLRQAGYVQVLR